MGGRAVRVLICPAWVDEANKLRRFTVEVMRRLDRAGIDTLLPDLPGCNESLLPPHDQTLGGWRSDMIAAAEALRATHVLALRAGAQVIASREAGIADTSEALMERGRAEGLVLGGWD